MSQIGFVKNDNYERDAVIQKPKWVCLNCGKRMLEIANFCSMCATPRGWELRTHEKKQALEPVETNE